MKKFIQSEAMFAAKLSLWREAREFLERFCLDAAIGRASGLRLNLILEELFTNTVNHGHRVGSEFFIWISLRSEEDGVAIEYADQAPPFNPLAMAARQLDLPIEEQKIGGLGVYLTTALTTRADYGYFYGRNRLRLLLPD